jgi:hypothetical protein
MVLKKNKQSWIRLVVSLILFFAASSCTIKESDETVSIQWENEQATGILIPLHHLKNIPVDSLTAAITVHLSDSLNRPAILGEVTVLEGNVLFEPLIPLLRGLIYEVRIGGKALTKIQIPEPSSSDAPRLLSVYPSCDTVPENLLKFYFVFSKPMREGQSLKHIFLLKNNGDTLFQTFLDLQPELWDRDGKQLTLWLDPGRIKRDLQPNQRMGLPLEKGTRYRVVVDNLWQDTRGMKLSEQWSRSFFVSGSDKESPDLKKWIVTIPSPGTRKPLLVEFTEPLDYVLSKQAIRILNANGMAVPGEIELNQKESGLRFTPDEPWQKDTYHLKSESRLEDLAGNNLDRLFDQEISAAADKQAKKHQIVFEVK